ncbi:MAG: class I SAM-dependent methyltransferase [Ilumatobacteraceae bacterium]
MSREESFDAAWAEVAEVQGWLTQDQALLLHSASAATEAGDTIVEIGSFRGRSTIVLAMAAPDGVEVVAIEPHAGNDRGPQEIAGYAAEASIDSEAFHANLARADVSDRVRHVRLFSHEAHDAIAGEIALLYVDGAHRYGAARGDVRDWGSRVAPGGTMMIHDSFSSIGVTLAIARELMGSRRWRYVERSRSLAVYRADLAGSGRSRWGNVARQLMQLPWFAKNLLVKVALTFKLGALMQKLTGRKPEWPY